MDLIGREELLKRIRARYPETNKLSDDDLADSIEKKYPGAYPQLKKKAKPASAAGAATGAAAGVPTTRQRQKNIAVQNRKIADLEKQKAKSSPFTEASRRRLVEEKQKLQAQQLNILTPKSELESTKYRIKLLENGLKANQEMEKNPAIDSQLKRARIDLDRLNKEYQQAHAQQQAQHTDQTPDQLRKRYRNSRGELGKTYKLATVLEQFQNHATLGKDPERLAHALDYLKKESFDGLVTEDDIADARSLAAGFHAEPTDAAIGDDWAAQFKAGGFSYKKPTTVQEARETVLKGARALTPKYLEAGATLGMTAGSVALGVLTGGASSPASAILGGLAGYGVTGRPGAALYRSLVHEKPYGEAWNDLTWQSSLGNEMVNDGLVSAPVGFGIDLLAGMVGGGVSGGILKLGARELNALKRGYKAKFGVAPKPEEITQMVEVVQDFHTKAAQYEPPKALPIPSIVRDINGEDVLPKLHPTVRVAKNSRPGDLTPGMTVRVPGQHGFHSVTASGDIVTRPIGGKGDQFPTFDKEGFATAEADQKLFYDSNIYQYTNGSLKRVKDVPEDGIDAKLFTTQEAALKSKLEEGDYVTYSDEIKLRNGNSVGHLPHSELRKRYGVQNYRYRLSFDDAADLRAYVGNKFFGEPLLFDINRRLYVSRPDLAHERFIADTQKLFGISPDPDLDYSFDKPLLEGRKHIHGYYEAPFLNPVERQNLLGVPEEGSSFVLQLDPPEPGDFPPGTRVLAYGHGEHGQAFTIDENGVPISAESYGGHDLIGRYTKGTIDLARPFVLMRSGDQAMSIPLHEYINNWGGDATTLRGYNNALDAMRALNANPKAGAALVLRDYPSLGRDSHSWLNLEATASNAEEPADIVSRIYDGTMDGQTLHLEGTTYNIKDGYAEKVSGDAYLPGDADSDLSLYLLDASSTDKSFFEDYIREDGVRVREDSNGIPNRIPLSRLEDSGIANVDTFASASYYGNDALPETIYVRNGIIEVQDGKITDYLSVDDIASLSKTQKEFFSFQNFDGALEYSNQHPHDVPEYYHVREALVNAYGHDRPFEPVITADEVTQYLETRKVREIIDRKTEVKQAEGYDAKATRQLQKDLKPGRDYSREGYEGEFQRVDADDERVQDAYAGSAYYETESAYESYQRLAEALESPGESIDLLGFRAHDFRSNRGGKFFAFDPETLANYSHHTEHDKWTAHYIHLERPMVARSRIDALIKAGILPDTITSSTPFEEIVDEIEKLIPDIKEGHWSASEENYQMLDHVIAEELAKQGYDGAIYTHDTLWGVPDDGRAFESPEFVKFEHYEQPPKAEAEAGGSGAEPPKEPPPTAEGAPEPEPHNDGPDGETSARNAQMEKDLDDFMLEGLPETEKKTWKETLRNAIKSGKVGRADLIAKGVIKRPRPLSDEDVVSLTMRMHELKQLHKQLRAQLRDPNLEEEDAIRLIDELEAVEEQFKTNAHALKITGRETARSLNVRKLTLDAEYDVQSVMERARQSKRNKKLTEKEEAGLREKAQELEDVEKEITDTEMKPIKDQASYTYKKEKAKEAREKLVEDLKNLFKKKGEDDSLHSGFTWDDIKFSAEALEKVGRIALTYAAEGAASMEELLAKLREHIPDIDIQGLRDAIAATGGKAKGAITSKTELEKDIAWLRSLKSRTKAQERKIAEYEAKLELLKQGHLPEKKTTKTYHDAKLDDLRKQAANLRKEIDRRIRALRPDKAPIAKAIDTYMSSAMLSNPLARAFDFAANSIKLVSFLATQNLVRAPISTALDYLLFKGAAGAKDFRISMSTMRRILDGARERWSENISDLLKDADPDVVAKFGNGNFFQHMAGITDVPFKDFYKMLALHDFAMSKSIELGGDARKTYFEAIWSQLSDPKSNSKLLSDAEVDAAHLLAEDFALRNTFNINNVVSALADGMQQQLSRLQTYDDRILAEGIGLTKVGVRMITRFSRVIGNVALERTNFIYPGLSAAEAGIRSANQIVRVMTGAGIDAKQARLITDLLTKSLTGVAMVKLGAAMYEKGLYDPELRKTKNGSYYWVDSLVERLGAGGLSGIEYGARDAKIADLETRHRLKKENAKTLRWKTGADVILNQPMFQGPSKFSEMTAGPAQASDYIQDMLLNNLIPGGIRQIARSQDAWVSGKGILGDPPRREANELWERIKERLPFFRTQLKSKKDKTIKRPPVMVKE